MGRPPVIPTTPQRCRPEVRVTTTCAMVVRLRPEEQRGWWFDLGEETVDGCFWMMQTWVSLCQNSYFKWLLWIIHGDVTWPSKMNLSKELGGGWILVLPRYINKDKSGNSKWLVKIDWLYPSLKPTAKAPENGWSESFPFLFGMAYFQLLLLLVSGAVNW